VNSFAGAPCDFLKPQVTGSCIIEVKVRDAEWTRPRQGVIHYLTFRLGTERVFSGEGVRSFADRLVRSVEGLVRLDSCVQGEPLPDWEGRGRTGGVVLCEVIRGVAGCWLLVCITDGFPLFVGDSPVEHFGFNAERGRVLVLDHVASCAGFDHPPGEG